ncbi:MAG: glycosyltransferase family 4 protein [Candidatus Aureabacteria bacterium]|nr:glycosyltransferase family 4 protein [Candidatus Auribacterota bacterium]
MKVCIEGQPFVSKRTGIGRYTYCLVREYVRRDPGMEISVFYFNARRNFREQDMIKKSPGLRNREIRWIPGFLAYKMWNTFSFPPVEFFTGTHDLYHFTNFTAAPVKRGKILLTVCDATIKRFPGTMEKTNRLRLERLMERSLHESSAVIAISEFTKKEIASLFQYPEERIFVTHLGIEDNFQKIRESRLLEDIKRKYGIQDSFILYAGTLEPRKNISHLIRAYNICAKEIPHHLVLVGRKGWSFEEIEKAIALSPFRERIHQLGYLPDQDLPAIYSCADLFVFPSLYEGFGFPPLEAMRCETPVLSSDRASLKEVLKDGAFYFNPHQTDEKALAVMIKDILSDKDECAEKVREGLQIARSYTWDKTAEKTLEIYKKVMKI